MSEQRTEDQERTGIEPFMFVFHHGGSKWSTDMTRDELLQVIAHLLTERDWWKNEARQRVFI